MASSNHFFFQNFTSVLGVPVRFLNPTTVSHVLAVCVCVSGVCSYIVHVT